MTKIRNYGVENLSWKNARVMLIALRVPNNVVKRLTQVLKNVLGLTFKSTVAKISLLYFLPDKTYFINYSTAMFN